MDHITDTEIVRTEVARWKQIKDLNREAQVLLRSNWFSVDAVDTRLREIEAELWELEGYDAEPNQ